MIAAVWRKMDSVLMTNRLLLVIAVLLLLLLFKPSPRHFDVSGSSVSVSDGDVNVSGSVDVSGSDVNVSGSVTVDDLPEPVMVTVN